AKQMVLKQFLSGYHVDELLSLGERFSEEVIPTMLRPEGMEKLRWHQQQGHECVLVSASLDIYLESWARKERLTAVLCTSLKKKNNGDVTGEIEGENCYGEEKVRRIKGWHKGKPAKNTYAYGDTSGDLPMIKSARQGYLWTKQENRFVANHRAS
uniref:HAD-IB family hydrolase n=1 Tax=Endozoicomonas sp. ONNA1 TaxID=2828740 RepID=UPI002147B3C2